MAEYDQNVGMLFAHTCRALRILAEAEFNKLGLYLGQDRVLLSLMDQESVGQSDLVTHLCVDASTVTKTLKRMERSGLVERHPDDQDGRVSRVCATDQGRALQENILQVWNDLEERLLANMTLPEQTLFRRLLIQALANLNDVQDET